MNKWDALVASVFFICVATIIIVCIFHPGIEVHFK